MLHLNLIFCSCLNCTTFFSNVYPDIWEGAAIQHLPSGLTELQMYHFLVVYEIYLCVFGHLILCIILYMLPWTFMIDIVDLNDKGVLGK